MKELFSLLIVFSLIHVEANAAWILKRTRNSDQIKEVGVAPIELAKISTLQKLNIPQVIKSLPRFLVEHGKSSDEKYEEVLWPSDELPQNYLNFVQSSQAYSTSSLPKISGELRTIVEQGPAKNRICLTFIGDGYTTAEKEKFYSDVAALVDDLFNGKTFQSYKSLFNVYAVFVASKDSGITDLQTKNTAFGLYRSPKGSKRAIMPGNTSAIDAAIAMAPKTDYPIIVANDDFYGGLGGEYAITTRSRESGKIVLRHELGHNFGSVGEEYDGGYVYQGANSSHTPDISWKQWLKSSQTKIVNDMRFLAGAYVWQNLENHPIVQNFTFPAPNAKGPFWFEVQLSSVGWEHLDEVEILLDGRKLEIQGKGTADRSFFNTKLVQDLNPGNHQLEIREVNHDGDNILAFADLYAYEADYDFSGGIGAFKTYDDQQSLSYRPTHQQCIMRDMLHEFFCPVDQENMWIEFLTRVRLIDQLQQDTKQVKLELIKLNGLSTQWFKNEQNKLTELTQFKNQTSLDKASLAKGAYVVKVKFETPEVKKTSSSLSDEISFNVN